MATGCLVRSAVTNPVGPVASKLPGERTPVFAGRRPCRHRRRGRARAWYPKAASSPRATVARRRSALAMPHNSFARVRGISVQGRGRRPGRDCVPCCPGIVLRGADRSRAERAAGRRPRGGCASFAVQRRSVGASGAVPLLIGTSIRRAGRTHRGSHPPVPAVGQAFFAWMTTTHVGIDEGRDQLDRLMRDTSDAFGPNAS